MSAPFAKAVAGRFMSSDVTPLNATKETRKYVLEYYRHAGAGATGPTEIIVNAMWSPQSALDVVSTRAIRQALVGS